MDMESGHGSWPVSQVWGTSLGTLCDEIKSTSYAKCPISPIKYNILKQVTLVKGPI